MRHLAACTALLVALGGLGGCSSAPPEKPPEKAPAVIATTPAPQASDPVDTALSRALDAQPDERRGLLLEAAELLVGRRDYARAEKVLREIRGVAAGSEQEAKRAILLSAALRGKGDAAKALDALSVMPGNAALPRVLEAEMIEARAEALLALGRPLEAAQERTALQPWLTDESARSANAKHILDALARVPLGEIDRAMATAGSEDWQGWLDLSVSARDMRRLPGEQRQRLQQWAQRHSGITAFGVNAPELAAGIAEGIAEPGKIALLLPLSGRAAPSGQAVLQGYLAEHYRALAAGEAVPALAIVDTAGTAEGFAAAYRRTTADGAQCVVGPLLKEELAAFGPTLAASTPTLALNFLDAPARSIPGVHQFGIDLSDEVAELSSGTPAARAVVLADGAPRSRRLVEDFSARWRATGREVIDTLYLGDLNAYRLSLEQTLHLDQSHERAAAISSLTGLELQTEPRRREDVDLVVLLAEPGGARSIRALLPFLYAGDVPVRGTSISYAAGSGRESDLDLDTLRFLDMPWFSGAEDALRDSASVQRGPVERLVALGVDARRLQSRLALLENPATRNLGGATGELSSGADGRVHRRAVWYVIDGGQAKAEVPRSRIATATSTEGTQAWTPAEGTVPPAPDAAPKTGH